MVYNIFRALWKFNRILSGSPDKYGGRYAAQMKYRDEKQRNGSRGAYGMNAGE